MRRLGRVIVSQEVVTRLMLLIRTSGGRVPDDAQLHSLEWEGLLGFWDQDVGTGTIWTTRIIS